MIAIGDLRDILAGENIMALPEGASDTTELAIDSFTLVKLQVELENRYGVEIDPRAEDLQLFTSVAGIHTYLERLIAQRDDRKETAASPVI